MGDEDLNASCEQCGFATVSQEEFQVWAEFWARFASVARIWPKKIPSTLFEIGFKLKNKRHNIWKKEIKKKI